MKEIAEAYAQAFLLLAKENNELLSLKKEVEDLLPIFDNKTLSFLKAGFIDKDAKKQVVKEAFKNANKTLVNLLCLLIDENRTYYTKAILQLFCDLANKALNIEEITIISATNILDSEVKTIVDTVARKINKKVISRIKIDPSLIAGKRIYVAGRVYDSSLQTRLKDMKEKILKESW